MDVHSPKNCINRYWSIPICYCDWNCMGMELHFVSSIPGAVWDECRTPITSDFAQVTQRPGQGDPRGASFPTRSTSERETQGLMARTSTINTPWIWHGLTINIHVASHFSHMGTPSLTIKKSCWDAFHWIALDTIHETIPFYHWYGDL